MMRNVDASIALRSSAKMSYAPFAPGASDHARSIRRLFGDGQGFFTSSGFSGSATCSGSH
jgi:hypothetical protein